MMISDMVAQDEDISIVELAGKLEQFIRRAAEDGESLHEVEQKVLGSVLLLGRRCVDQFLTFLLHLATGFWWKVLFCSGFMGYGCGPR